MSNCSCNTSCCSCSCGSDLGARFEALKLFVCRKLKEFAETVSGDPSIMTDNGNGTYTHTSGAAVEVILNTRAAANPWVDTNDVLGGGAGAESNVQNIIDRIVACILERSELVYTIPAASGDQLSIDITTLTGYTALHTLDNLIDIQLVTPLGTDNVSLMASPTDITGNTLTLDLSGSAVIGGGKIELVFLKQKTSL